jgi:pseudouridine synthase
MRIDPTLDKVCVDGTPVTVGNDKRAGQIGKDTSSDNDGEPSTSFHEHEYILYWKPVGITCTCDVRIPGNLVEALHRRSGNLVEARPDDGGGYEPAPRRRVFPVGRLDRDTSGLLLLTSDGDLPNAVLRGESSQPKTYLVTLDRPIRPEDVRDLEEGVVITTETSRRRRRRRSAAPPPKQDGGAISAYRRTLRTAPTRPARASVRPDRPNELFITIREGRNRQVRKMIKAVGYEVHKLHRTEFAGLTLEGLDGPGNWRRLTEDERVRVVRRVMSRAAGHHRGA